MAFPDSLSLGAVTLRVKDLDLLERFYSHVLGLDVLSSSVAEISLGSAGDEVLKLVKSDLPFAAAEAAGLYHTAFLYSLPSGLAQALLRASQAAPALFQGSSDHLVSMAFYFSDPEGNGVELYVDRPRSEWKWIDGGVQMASLPLDPSVFIGEHARGEAGTVSIGHMHLKVGNVAKAKAFYVDILGFDVMAELDSGLFVSAGKYHHHLGMNIWESEGAQMRVPALGLESFSIKIPAGDIDLLKKRLETASVEFAEEGGTLRVEDPWGNAIAFAS